MDNLIQRLTTLVKLTADQRNNLLRKFASAPHVGKVEISRLQQKYYSAVPRETLTEAEFEAIKNLKHTHPAIYNLYCLYLGIEDYLEMIRRKQGTSDPLITAIREDRRKNQINRCRRQTTLDRIRAIYPEIRNLLEEQKLKWPEILQYIKRHHRKMFAKSKLSTSWLRRSYYKIKDDRENLTKEKSPV
jgi:hypothetical protein